VTLFEAVISYVDFVLYFKVKIYLFKERAENIARLGITPGNLRVLLSSP